MRSYPLPLERLVYFQEQLALSRDELEVLAPYRRLFTRRKDEFAGYLHNFFYKIVRTRMILQYERKHGQLREAWANWFETLFTTTLDEAFYALMWHSGVRHVAVNLDQRFINLGYCIVRQYCHQIVRSEIPLASRPGVLLVIDKLLDLCLLIETNAYMMATSYCDQEVIKGISHQIRNPITVIGGNALRLQKRLGGETQLGEVCESIILESKRLERLVNDIGIYIDLFQQEARYSVYPLEAILTGAINRLPDSPVRDRIELALNPAFPDVQGDPKDLEVMFYYLLENSIEAVPADDPVIRISSKLETFASYFIQVEIFNNGAFPKKEEIENLFAPFHSSKPTGTGFGLPIAQLAAQKNLVNISLIPVEGTGTRCLVNLPLPS